MESRYWHRGDFRLSVRPYPPSKIGSIHPILKILFLLERYNIRDLSFIIFVRLSVRPDGHGPPVCRLFPIEIALQLNFYSFKSVLSGRFSKFFFCLKGTASEINILYFFVCPSVRTNGHLSHIYPLKSH